MAIASFLLRPTDSSHLRPIRVGGRGVVRPVTPFLYWFPICSSLQKSLHVVPLLGPNSVRTSSPTPSLGAFRGNTLPRYPSLRACGSGFVFNTIVVYPLSSNMTRRLKAGAADKARNGESSSELAIKDEESGLLSPGWPTSGLALFCLGFLLGPPLDGIHSRVQLQIYDNGAIDLFGLQTNIWVPPMLGVFYSLAGLLQLVLDKKFAPKGNIPTASLTKVAASLISLTVLLELSAEMYLAGLPFNIEGYILFLFAELNWLLLENTWWGFGLASFIGIVCPLAEIAIVKLFGLWHYPRANVNLFGEGFITWVICCYFFYTPFISNLARWLSSYQKEQGKLRL